MDFEDEERGFQAQAWTNLSMEGTCETRNIRKIWWRKIRCNLLPTILYNSWTSYWAASYWTRCMFVSRVQKFSLIQTWPILASLLFLLSKWPYPMGFVIKCARRGGLEWLGSLRLDNQVRYSKEFFPYQLCFAFSRVIIDEFFSSNLQSWNARIWRLV